MLRLFRFTSTLLHFFRIRHLRFKICVYYCKLVNILFMKATIALLTLVFGILLAASAQEPIRYDSTYAKRLGADQYGMRRYVMVFLKRGTANITDTAQRNGLQRAHLANIGKLAREGKLIVAGPFTDRQDIRGIYIFAVSSLEEAQQLANTDPAVKAGTLIMELHPWYGSAALMEVPNIHPKLQRSSIF